LSGPASRIIWLWKQRATRIGCLLTALIGVLLIWEGGGVLERLSFDVPCLFQNGVPKELVMVRIDAEVKRNLNQPTDQPLNRRFYAQLLDRLREDGAKLVFYDLLLDEPSADPADDAVLSDAMNQHKHVVLVEKDLDQRQGDIITARVIQPIKILRESAAGCGLARFDCDPGDFVRRLSVGLESEPSVGWVAADLLGAPLPLTPQARLKPRWINYYCAPIQLPTITFDQALSPDGPTNGYFRDKIVVVGRFDDPEDTFQTPHSRFASGPVSNGFVAPGAAIQAINLLNLLHGDSLTRLPMIPEMVIVAAWGVIVTILLMLLRPWPAICAALALGALFTFSSILLAQKAHVWFPWAIPVAAQTPFALVWAVGFESVRRRRLRRAFGLYLSPYMADEIANSDFDPSLGGKEVEATVMFTDLEGFTKMAEPLTPTEVSNILISYFNQTSKAILDLDGTVIKYIGDAVMAAWGAPLPDPNHPQTAVSAALAMHRAGEKEIEGRRLRTRFGINTGICLAGNLGSDTRFDYTLFGDTTNLASRLEGLNKYLETEILISDSTRSRLNGSVKARPLGRFILAGMTKPVLVHEVLGEDSEFETEPAWLKSFSQALDHFTKREFDPAEILFRKAIETRQGHDGPSEFYLRQIETARRSPAGNTPWDGTVRLAEK
jgi:adenylate cyclase